MRRHLLVGLGLALTAVGTPALAKGPPVLHQTLVWHGAEVHVVRVAPYVAVRPVARRPGRTVPAFVQGDGAVAGINGGYFNHSDGYPVSHVVRDGRPVNDPRKNKALLGNAVLKPILPRIFDERVEWRALNQGGSVRWSFEAHRSPVPPGASLTHALQAGPRLLPTLNLEAEGFVVRNDHGAVVRDGIASMSPAARSALGLTPQGELLLVAVAGSSKRTAGISIPDLAALMGHLGAHEAMALDGGGSTTLTWREQGAWKTFVGNGQGPALVHSALVVLR